MVATVSLLNDSIVCVDINRIGCIYIPIDYYDSYLQMMQDFAVRKWRWNSEIRNI